MVSLGPARDHNAPTGESVLDNRDRDPSSFDRSPCIQTLSLNHYLVHRPECAAAALPSSFENGRRGVRFQALHFPASSLSSSTPLIAPSGYHAFSLRGTDIPSVPPAPPLSFHPVLQRSTDSRHSFGQKVFCDKSQRAVCCVLFYGNCLRLLFCLCTPSPLPL